MIGNNQYSIWGIKDSGEDITDSILSILRNARRYIIVGGYNFTYQTAGYSFFPLLLERRRAGVEVLMIIPPSLYGINHQRSIIDFCINNDIALILNGNNHSKWLLTEKDLYYGSSNFTNYSWRSRVEVVTIHKHDHIFTPWKVNTLLDFKLFVQREMSKIHRRSTMSRRGLITHTQDTWNRINTLILRLNPSKEKVRITLESQNEVNALLDEILEYWFASSYQEDFITIYKASIRLKRELHKLYRYAYIIIYNEFDTEKTLSPRQILKYNSYYKNYKESLSECESIIGKLSEEHDYQSNFSSKNMRLISNVETALNTDSSNFL